MHPFIHSLSLFECWPQQCLCVVQKPVREGDCGDVGRQAQSPDRPLLSGCGRPCTSICEPHQRPSLSTRWVDSGQMIRSVLALGLLYQSEPRAAGAPRASSGRKELTFRGRVSGLVMGVRGEHALVGSCPPTPASGSCMAEPHPLLSLCGQLHGASLHTLSP